MTVSVLPLFSAAGPLTVAYRCAGPTCTWESKRVPVDQIDVIEDVRTHLAGQHSDEVGYGLCAVCGAVTDYFRALVPELGTDTWLCDDDGPTIPVVTDQAGNDTEEIQWSAN